MQVSDLFYFACPFTNSSSLLIDRLLGDAYEQIEEMDLSLAMYVCAFETNQDFTPIHQLETVITEKPIRRSTH